MANKQKEKMDNGTKTLLICGIIAVVLIVACVFFPDAIFGIFLN